MASLTNYKGLNVVEAASGAGGEALTDNYKELADRAGPVYMFAGDPNSTHDGADTASVGIEFQIWSKWRNSSDNGIFTCVDNSTGAAVWIKTAPTGDVVQGSDHTYDLQAKDDGSPDGDPRGENSVDFQTARGSAEQIAEGDYSVISGGASNYAPADYSMVPGGLEAKAEYPHGMTQASGYFAETGDAQSSVLTAKKVTVGAGQTWMLINDADLIEIPTDKTITFQITVVARRLDDVNEGAGWHFLGVIENTKVGAITTVSFIGVPTKTEIANDNSEVWDCDVDDNNTDDSLDILVTGEIGKTIRWVARIEFTEVGDSVGGSS